MTTVETTIPNTQAGIQRVSRIVDELASAHHLSENVVADIQVALDEVLANIISFGYPEGGVHEIWVRVTLVEHVLTAEIEDDGKPFNPLEAARPDLSGGLKERRVGGLGIHFVRELMDAVEYARVENRNRLVLRRRTGR